MKCQWEGCQEEIGDDIKDHIEGHIKGSATLQCLWVPCLRNKEPFSSKYSLYAHSKIHTGEKPFNCPKCTAIFSRTDGLNKHLKKHSEYESQANERLGKYLKYCSERKFLMEETTGLLKERQRLTDVFRVLNDALLFPGEETEDGNGWESYGRN